MPSLPPPAARKKAPLDQRQRLSRSILWRWQRSFFERRGTGAWSAGTVPHHITSNPFLADAYAQVTLGFLRDVQGAGADPGQPVHLVELGTGSGRFGYLFLKKLLALHQGSSLRGLPIRYVMTDFTAANLDPLRAHPALRPWIEAGLLDFAVFDAERDADRDATLTLLVSGEQLAPGSLRNPLAVIANYVFDSLPQDAFTVAAGRLAETLVTVSSSQNEPDLDDPTLLERVEVDFDDEPVEGAYYEREDWNLWLEDYRQRRPSSSFLFPTAAFRCIDRLLDLAAGRLLLLTGDRGTCDAEAALLPGEERPRLVIHGSFSLPVDFHLLGEHCRGQGGLPLHPAHPVESLNVSALLFGGGFPETRLAYAEAIEKFGPDDFFVLKGVIEPIYPVLSLEEILAFLRWTGWDAKRFAECLPVLKERVEDFSAAQKTALLDVIRRVWDAYLPIGEEQDLAFAIGTFLIELELYAEALPFLDCSLRLYGIEPGTAYNRALCHYGLEQLAEAQEWIDRALGAAPDFAAARALRQEIDGLQGS